ncbi:MAG: NAD(P)/FAD-dependent oxidoreductase [Bacteroidaceae bacterium]|nr:NAD(P)/FAD-dependent oxidoreductase [Bacteroidaceae bacterium]
MRYDIVIIGSGLGGMECAHILSRRGQRVMVLEGASQLGGCMQSYRRRGLELDTGVHYVGGLDEGESLYPYFKELGLMKLPWHRLDSCFERILIDGKTYCFAQGFDNFVEVLARDFPEDRAGLQQLSDMLRMTAKAERYDKNYVEQTEMSAWGYIEQTIKNPLLRAILCVPMSVKGEMRMESLPLFSFLHINSGCIESAWRLKGAGNLIVRSLVDDIESEGGGLLTGRQVCRLDVVDGNVRKAVCTNGEEYEAEMFISDVHPALTLGLIEGKIGPYRKRVEALPNTEGVFTVSLILKPRSLKYFNWNQYIPAPHIEAALTPVATAKGENGGVEASPCANAQGSGTWMLVSSRVPEDGGDYCAQIDLLVPMGRGMIRRDESYVRRKRRFADECIKCLERFFIPNITDITDAYYVSTPSTYERYTMTPGGSAFGIRKDYRSPMTTFLTPRTPLRNLFLTGQSLVVHGIQGVTMTAFETCRLISEQ